MSVTVTLRTWAARHAQTLVGSLGSIVKQPLAALMTMAVIGLALALPSFLAVMLQNSRTATVNWNQTFDISVYMDVKAPPTRTQALAAQLRSRSDVAGVRVITAAQALRQFRDESGFGSALDALRDNPLPDTLVVTPALAASNPDGMETLKRAVTDLPAVQSVQIDTDWVKRLQSLLDVARRIVWLIATLLGLGVVLVVGNTVRLDILNRRTEIEVMKLVGATDGFARRPFLYRGIWYGLGGGLLALAAVGTAVRSLAGPVDRLAALYASRFHLQGMGLGFCAAEVAGAMGLAWLGSWLAATHHIRRIEPS